MVSRWLSQEEGISRWYIQELKDCSVCLPRTRAQRISLKIIAVPMLKAVIHTDFPPLSPGYIKKPGTTRGQSKHPVAPLLSHIYIYIWICLCDLMQLHKVAKHTDIASSLLHTTYNGLKINCLVPTAFWIPRRRNFPSFQFNQHNTFPSRNYIWKSLRVENVCLQLYLWVNTSKEPLGGIVSVSRHNPSHFSPWQTLWLNEYGRENPRKCPPPGTHG